MQIYDIIMLVVLVGAVLFGMWKGFAWQVASVAAIFVSYFVALTFSTPVAALIDAEEPWDRFIAMFGLFLGTSLAVWIAFGFIKSRIEKMKLTTWDRHGGAILGGLKGALLCLVITFFAVTLLGPKQKEAICNSHSGRFMAKTIGNLSAIMPTEVHAVLKPHLDKLSTELQKNHSDSDDETTTLNDIIPDSMIGLDEEPDPDASLADRLRDTVKREAKKQVLDAIPTDPTKIDWRKIDWERAAKAIGNEVDKRVGESR